MSDSLGISACAGGRSRLRNALLFVEQDAINFAYLVAESLTLSYFVASLMIAENTGA